MKQVSDLLNSKDRVAWSLTPEATVYEAISDGAEGDRSSACDEGATTRAR